MAIDLSQVAGIGADPIQAQTLVPCCIKSTPYDFIVRELSVSGAITELGDQSLPTVPHALSLAAAQQAVEEQNQSLQYTASLPEAASYWLAQLGASQPLLAACDFAFDPSGQSFQDWSSNASAAAHAQSVRSALGAVEQSAAAAAVPSAPAPYTADSSFSLPLAGTDIGSDKDARRTARRALAVLFPHLDVALAADSREPGAPYTQVVLKPSRQASQIARLLPTDDCWDLLVYLSKGSSEAAASAGVHFSLPAEKQQRKRLFDFLRKAFRNVKLASSTEDADGNAVQHVRFQAKQVQGGRKRGRGGALEGGADAAARVAPSTWLHFNLQKVGLEQMTVMSDIAKRCGGALWEVAGIKDKQGATIQRACVRGVQPTALLAAMREVEGALASSSARHHVFPERCVSLPPRAQDASALELVSPVAVGGLQLHPSSLQAGDQGGNAFTITLRPREVAAEQEAAAVSEQLQRVLDAQADVCGVSETLATGYDDSLIPTLAQPAQGGAAHSIADAGGALSSAMQRVSEAGFVNVFGHQRVGAGFLTSGFAAPELGAATFRFDFDQILHRALMGRPLRSERSPDNQLGIMWAANWRSHIDKKLDLDKDRPRPHKGFIAQMLKACPGSCGTQKVVLAAAKKASTFDMGLLEVPQAHRKIWMHGYQSLVWNRMACIRRAMAPTHVIEGDLVAVDADSQGLDAWEERAARPSALAAAAERPGAMQGRWSIHTVTAAEASSGKFDISHVVLPIPGAGVLFPQHAVGHAYMRHLWQDQTHAALWPTVAAGMRLQRLSGSQTDAIAATAAAAVRQVVQLGHTGPAEQGIRDSLERTAAAQGDQESTTFETAFGDISLPEDAIASAAAVEARFGAVNSEGMQGLQARAQTRLDAGMELPKWLAAASKGGYRHLIVKPAGAHLWTGAVPEASSTPRLPADLQLATNKQPAAPETADGEQDAAIASFSLPPGSYATVFLSTLTGGGAWETSVRR